jgi:hypothetical protein
MRSLPRRPLAAPRQQLVDQVTHDAIQALTYQLPNARAGLIELKDAVGRKMHQHSCLIQALRKNIGFGPQPLFEASNIGYGSPADLNENTAK